MEKNQDHKESKKVDRTLHIKRYDNIKNPVIFDRISKEVIKAEREAERKWLARYECLSREYFQKVP